MLYICEVGVLEGHDKRVGVGRKRVGWALGLHKGGPKWGMWGGISRNGSVDTVDTVAVSEVYQLQPLLTASYSQSDTVIQ